MDKLKIGWGIRAKRFEERIRNREGSLVEQCWRKKEEGGWKDMYGLERMRWCENSEGEREYSEIDLIKRERDSTRAEESRKIVEARCIIGYIRRF